MYAFIERFYLPIASLLIVGIVVLSFLIGKEQGRAQNDASPVVLSCDEEILKSLQQTSIWGDFGSINGAQKEVTSSVLGVVSNAENQRGDVQKGMFVGSKNGTKYYTPNCPGLAKIKPENYVWFSDEKEAQLQGYSPASC